MLTEGDFVDFYGCIILPMAAPNLVLAASLKLQDDHLGVSVLGDDLSSDFGSHGVLAGHELLLVVAHGQHFAESDLFAQFARQRFHLYGLARRHTILLTTTANHGVHLPSSCYGKHTLYERFPNLVNAIT